MWDRVKVATKPTADVISVADLKTRLRIDSSDEDALLASLVSGAVASIDGPSGIGYAMMEQTWRLTLDGFPSVIRLPGAPVKSVTTITYVDTDGVEQTMLAADYRVDTGSDPARIEPVYGGTWPTARDVIGAVKVDYVLGESASSSVPQNLIDAVCLIVGHRYENREAVGQNLSELPLSVEWILREYRNGTVA